MPEIKLKHVVSCSSEDKVHKAENLLKCETYRKWKCAAPGEKQASIILQFEKAFEIYSIDIGNEGSAFIEVSVGKSSSTNNEFQILLVASSFMSPLESRNETKTNRVRMFGPDKLSQNLKNEKWDCVKIVCTQPFNKNIQYGLSFVKFHSPPELPQQTSNEFETKESFSQLGAFKLKAEEEEEENNLSVGGWFSKRNESPNSTLTGPAAIRQASSYASAALSTLEKHEIKISPKPIVQKREIGSNSMNREKESVLPLAKKDKIVHSRFSDHSKGDKEQFGNKTADTSNKFTNKVFETKKKPFNEIMKKVVFVLSGFQNPFRNELRQKALEMGAKYKADWDDSCTHLVCAFLNTPKYSQVLRKNGRIVMKEWIIDCYKKRSQLPWRKYMLGKYTKDLTTEDESEEEMPLPQNKKISMPTPQISKKDDEMEVDVPESLGSWDTTIEKNGTETNTYSQDSEEDYQAPTDIDSSSGGDTEDEIRKAMEESAAKKVKNLAMKGKGIGSFSSFKESSLLDCDEENEVEKAAAKKELVKPDTHDIALPSLPNIFKAALKNT